MTPLGFHLQEDVIVVGYIQMPDLRMDHEAAAVSGPTIAVLS